MNKTFIGMDKNAIPPYKSTSLLLRRSFSIRDTGHKFTIQVIGLGIGVYYLNGKRITDNVLCTPLCDYSKTLYYEEYDVTDLIMKGNNVFAAELGNGFYNESLDTSWKFNTSHWRGDKCLYLKLKSDDRTILRSDDKFKARYSPYITYNEIRGEECFDKREYIDFQSLSFDDSSWQNAIYVDKQPKGKIRKNICPPIKEFERYRPIKIIKNKNGYVYDFGKNMSGYVRAKLNGNANKEIIFKYAEDVTKEWELDLHGLDCYQNGEPFQSDRCICDGSAFYFSPKFTYHGFRYVEVNGVDDIDDISLEAIFIHHDIKYLGRKPLGNDDYQKIFDAGVRSILSNTYYGFTDCPTREKLNWLNDLCASLPVIMEYFDCKDMLRKIYQDIIDSQDENGNVPGITPSPRWGYEYGPVCSCVTIILPYLYYKKFGDDSLFSSNIANIRKYYEFIKNNIESDYFILGEWTGATNHIKTPKSFIFDAYMYIFDKILMKMDKPKRYESDCEFRVKRLNSYDIVGQTMPATLLVLGLGNKDKNIDILTKDIKDNDYHLDAGMFGSQFIFKALFDNGFDEIIYKIVCNKKAPSFKNWIDNGATTLFETFADTWSLSMNHHMYSNVILYLK